MNDNYRDNCLKVVCDMYAPSAYPLFAKNMPSANEDESGSEFVEYFELLQTVLSLRGKNVDIAERREVAATIRPKLEKFGLPETIARNLEARNNHDSLNSI